MLFFYDEPRVDYSGEAKAELSTYLLRKLWEIIALSSISTSSLHLVLKNLLIIICMIMM